VKHQLKKYSCGAAAIRNILRSYEIYVNEHKVWSYSRMTSEGVDEEDIMTALHRFGFEIKEHKFSNKKEAWVWLHTKIVSGYRIILSVYDGRHWVVAYGSCGDGIAIFDSDFYEKYTKEENGSYVWSYKKTMANWIDNDNLKMYAISARLTEYKK